MQQRTLDIPTPSMLASRQHHPAGKGRATHRTVYSTATPTRPAPAPASVYDALALAPQAAPVVETPNVGAHAIVRMIGPVEARALLDANTAQNRNLDKRTVARYVADMRAGAWEFNGEPILIGTDGTMLDGQHRCTAIIEAGVSVPILVVTGIKPKALSTINSGKIRTMAQILHFNDIPNGKTVSSVGRIVMGVQARMTQVMRCNPSAAALMAWLEHNDISEAVALASSARSARSPMNRAVLGAAFHICSQIDEDDARTFFIDQFINTVGLTAGSPALALRNRLSNGTETTTNGKENQLRYTFHAWNAFREGRELTRIQAPQGGWTAKNAPFPH